jgi:hypothetical protein
MKRYGSTEAEFLQNAPANIDIPDELLAFLEIENPRRRTLTRSADFALRPFGHHIARLYFGDADIALHFMVFGGDSGGGTYALWLYEGRTIYDAPVVYLESEGQYCVVLASSLKEFIRLLMIGIEEPGYSIEVGDWKSNISETEATQQFSIWAQKRFGFSAPADPFEIVTPAREIHPNLEQWLAGREVPRGFTWLP